MVILAFFCLERHKPSKSVADLVYGSGHLASLRRWRQIDSIWTEIRLTSDGSVVLVSAARCYKG